MKKTKKELKKEGAKAGRIIQEALVMNDIPFGIGMDAIQGVYAYATFDNEFTYEEYCESIDKIKKGYKKLWE